VLPKSKGVVFISPEILRLSEISSSTKWHDFRLLATNFLSNNKADNDNLPVENLLLSYQKFGCIMSFKALLTNYHQDIFPGKYRVLNNEHGECFRHNISAMEMTYQDKWISPMMAEYRWIIRRDSLDLCTKGRLRGSAASQSVHV
jgi:hypothetical protein